MVIRLRSPAEIPAVTVVSICGTLNISKKRLLPGEILHLSIRKETRRCQIAVFRRIFHIPHIGCGGVSHRRGKIIRLHDVSLIGQHFPLCGDYRLPGCVRVRHPVVYLIRGAVINMCAVFRQIAPKQLDTGIAARADRLCFQCLRFIGCRHFTRNDVLQIPFQRQTVDQRIAVPQAPHFHAAPVAVRKLCAICITDHHAALLLRRHRKCSLCISCHLIGCSNQRLRGYLCCLSLPGDRCV